LLLPFIENAFKHGSHFPKADNEIRIRLTRSDKAFTMNVFNTKDFPYTEARSAGGIGLKNVRRRMELLYNGRHRLDIRETRGTFEVDLQLQIS
jgi:LytS/YehU family sensor histidine kinase